MRLRNAIARVDVPFLAERTIFPAFGIEGGNDGAPGELRINGKKTDPKKSKFTLYVLAEDKKFEKKDRTINEPLQFYTGRDRALFEVVVNSVDKNTVTGYLSTPKNVASTQMPSHAPSSQ